MRPLRILHVATLITPDGAYGGPVRVATNQVKALRDLGHDAVLVAGATGFAVPPTEWDGAPVRTFPVHEVVPRSGFAGLASPRMLRWLQQNRASFDVAHLHLARDLVVLPAARSWSRSGRPFVTQTHGMVVPSSNRLAAPLDRAMTRRVLRAADANLYLTDEERDGLRNVAAGALNTRRLVNGVPLPAVPPPGAPETEAPVEVLFLARLHAVKQPLAFVHAATELAPRHPRVRFTLVGPDGGEGPAVESALRAIADPDVRERVRWEGGLAPDETLERIARAAVYVLPSTRDVFPMSVLEAMSCARPVVVTRACGLAAEIGRAEAGLVIEDVPGLVPALDRLLGDPALRERLGANARRLIETSFSMPAVAAELSAIYRTGIQVGAQRA